MDIKIDRKSGIPIYIQVKNQIMNEIKNGNLKVGTKMLTERELAQKLNASRNTISAAYNLLEQEGVLVSYQGRGTFVAEERKTWKQHSTKDKLLKIIDLGIEEALEQGLDPKEFLLIANERVKEKEELMRKVNAVFIECNIEQARVFAKELSRLVNVNVTPLVVGELKNRDEETQKSLEEAQILIATFNHVNEVKELTVDIDKDVLGVAINPCLETIVKIARYPRKTKFGLVCISKEFHFKVENAIKSSGIDIGEIYATTSRIQGDIEGVIRASDVIIVSPGRREDVKKLLTGNNKKEVISFDYSLDQGSVKAVISKIMESKKHA
ncbi:MAG: GntR family transcriptional regulator [Clostridiales bacterium]|jgi:DNA-binding transcriptional regulator YhcF (GntR family)|nr:GntR family transcriptional regulator [Clostridiales bacterium]